MYAQLSAFFQRFFKKSTIYKYGFNISPMYRRSTGRVISVTDDLLEVKVKIPISWKNKNYVNSIFGGSLFSATDPIYMIQLINILEKDYVVWDKSSEIKFKRPAKENAYADFIFTQQEIEDIKQQVAQRNEIDHVKTLKITNKDGSTVFCELEKTIYIANKAYYLEKRKQRREKRN